MGSWFQASRGTTVIIPVNLLIIFSDMSLRSTLLRVYITVRK